MIISGGQFTKESKFGPQIIKIVFIKHLAREKCHLRTSF